MSIFSKIFGKTKNENSPKFKEEMACKLDRKVIKYVTERKDGIDTVIGKRGCLYHKEDRLQVISDDGVVFDGKVRDILMSELLSKEGVIVSGPDLSRGGEYREIVCYYTYYIHEYKRDL